MLYAVNNTGDKIRPMESKGVAKDIYSGYPATSKVKEAISMWEVSETEPELVDPWMLPYTKWAMEWRLKFPREMVEEVLSDEKGNKHIADVCTADGTVLKFQHRHLDIVSMRKREKFFNKMRWILNASSWEMNLTAGATHYCDIHGQQLPLPQADDYTWTAYTSIRSKTIYQSCKCPVFLDFGDHLLHWINWQGRSGLQMQFGYNGGILKTFTKQQLLDAYTKQPTK